jgi:hypothetical protein
MVAQLPLPTNLALTLWCADDFVFSYMIACASILTGEALESSKGGDFDLQGNHPVDFDHLSILPDALLRDIISRLSIKETTRTMVLSRC